MTLKNRVLTFIWAPSIDLQCCLQYLPIVAPFQNALHYHRKLKANSFFDWTVRLICQSKLLSLHFGWTWRCLCHPHSNWGPLANLRGLSESAGPSCLVLCNLLSSLRFSCVVHCFRQSLKCLVSLVPTNQPIAPRSHTYQSFWLASLQKSCWENFEYFLEYPICELAHQIYLQR